MIINGTFADEIILGTEFADTIRGDGGDDQIDAGDGNDAVYGGWGDDLLVGGEGNDLLQDDEGSDEVYGGNGNDSFFNSIASGNWDLLYGGAGDDSFLLQRQGFFSHVSAYGEDGADSFTIADFAGGSIFEIDGGTGNDNILVQNLSIGSIVEASLGAGADMVLLIAPGTGTLIIEDFETGDAGDRLELMTYFQIMLIGYDRVSNIFATGHVRLVQSGADTLVQIDRDGGAGSFSFTTFVTLKNVTATALTGYNLSGYPADGTVPSGLAVTGTADADRLHGSMADDTLEGLDGRDLIYAGAGNDIVRGGAGADSLYGHYGNDTLEGGDDADYLEDGHGNDIVKGEGGNDGISSTASGNDSLDGGAGSDVITASRSGVLTDTVTVNAGDDNDRITLASQTESSFTLDAGSGDDRVTLNAMNGVAALTLGLGADRLILLVPNTTAYNNWGEVSVTDFDTGDGADIFEFSSFLRTAAPGWDQVTNPFATGHARMVQDGANVLFQVSANADPANFRTIVTFQNETVASFTVQNLYGWPVDGSPPPGLTLTGTASNDSIEGTAGPDTIEGLDGPDSLSGGAGNDTIRGGGHNDNLNGGLGDDLIEGGTGDDIINGGDGTDEVHGGEGNDSIYVNVGSGPDTVFGEGGNDFVNLNAVSGAVSGGAGDDRISVWFQSGDAGAITLLGDDGNDTVEFINGGLVDFTVDLGAGNDIIHGLPFNRDTTVTLGAGSDRVVLQYAYQAVPMGVPEILDFATGTGGDYLDTGNLIGGINRPDWESSAFSTGYARLVQDGADTLLQIDMDGAGATYGFTTALILRNTLATALTPGNLGYGTDGADFFRLDIAHDVVGQGAKGNDSYYLGAHLSAGDYLDGGFGVDTVAIQGDYSAGLALDESTLTAIETLALLSGSDTSFGGTGTEQYDYFLTLHDENVEAGQTLNVYFAGLQAGEDVIFNGTAETNGRFNITGGAGDDVIGGGAGSDRLDGGLGIDILAGGLGNDIYIVGEAGDVVVELEGEGTDEIRTALGSRVDFTQMYTLPDQLENLTGTSATGQGVYANGANNLVRMGAGGDLVVLDAGGVDTVEGGGGNDFLYYGGALTAADSNDGGAGFDTVGLLGTYSLTLGATSLVGIEKLALYSSGVPASPNNYAVTTVDANVAAGQALMVVAQSLAAGESLSFNGAAETDGRFNVRGGKGADTIVGGARSDQIWGNLGADTLTGGAGADWFEYHAAAESTAAARDTILDFAAGDRIYLAAIDADGNAANGDTAFSFIGTGAFTNQAGQLRATQADGVWTVEADIDGNGAADLVIAVQTVGGHMIGAADFWL